jgi:hypothetical protein
MQSIQSTPTHSKLVFVRNGGEVPGVFGIRVKSIAEFVAREIGGWFEKTFSGKNGGPRFGSRKKKRRRKGNELRFGKYHLVEIKD